MPVLETGLAPMSPRMDVVPVVEIPDLARIVKLAALPRFTGVCTAGAAAELDEVMDRALPKAERLARAPNAERRIAVFTVIGPLETCARDQRATTAAGEAVGFGAHGIADPPCARLLR
jgi:hypothetical protein